MHSCRLSDAPARRVLAGDWIAPGSFGLSAGPSARRRNIATFSSAMMCDCDIRCRDVAYTGPQSRPWVFPPETNSP